MKSLIICFLFVSFSAAAFSAKLRPGLKEGKSEWFRCKSDKDCVLVSAVCAQPLAVNKSFKKAAQDQALIEGGKVVCNDVAPPAWPSGAKCEKGICVFKKKK